MREGLYEVRFGTPLGEGRGLVNLQGGQVLGGDSIIIYFGSYSVEGERFVANVETKRYATEPGMISVLGKDSARIAINGTVLNDSINGKGHSQDTPGVALNVALRRIAP